MAGTGTGNASASPPAADTKNWHAYPSAEAVMAELNTTPNGLAREEVAERMKRHGPNRLTPTEKQTFLRKLWNQLNNILIYILVVAAIVSIALKQWAEVGLIVGVIVINVIIGLIQEGKAEKAAEALKAMLSSRATAVRCGERVNLEADELVPGDIVFLQSGDRVPADLRMLQVTNLQVMEAMLTGESLPVAKNLQAVGEASALGDRKCMAYSATMVMAGQGLGIVVETGDSAEIGKINKMVGEVENQKTNLIVQLEIFGRWISVVVLLVALGAFLLAYIKDDHPVKEAFESAVAIAVAIIPEGLPAVVTITLAIGVSQMAKQHAIIRQLPCVETLGSITVICSDKTGTLTKNEMTAVAVRTSKSHFKVTGVGYAPVGQLQTADNAALGEAQAAGLAAMLRCAALCNDSSMGNGTNAAGKEEWVTVGDPTELALLTLAHKAGIEPKKLSASSPRVASIPFESDHKFMGSVHRDGAQHMLYVKGAPDRLIPCCGHQVADDDPERTAPIDASFWLAAASELSSQGLRVLALCQAPLHGSHDFTSLSPAYVNKRPPFLTMVALAAILDPPREECIPAIREAHTAGIVVKMITGDHAQTALAIGTMLGIADEHHSVVYTGPELDQMSDEQLQDVVMSCNIYARASPENKIRIVRALQAKGQVCSMTGDGVNDAPALKAADIGVAMGITGTDVSKEAAKMVLADDNFATIVMAVREGRRVWDNLRKILVFNTPVNFAQGLSVFFAYVVPLGGPNGRDANEPPLTAIQVLYVNLITSVTMGLMLAAEPPEPDVMKRPPRRPGKRLLGKIVIWRSIFVSAAIICLVLGMYQVALQDGLSLKRARAEAFNVLVFCEIAYALNSRYIKATSIHRRILTGNKWAYVSIGLTAVLQVMITYIPGLNEFFSMRPMDGKQWGRVIACMFAIFFLVELEKVLVDPVLMPIMRPVLRTIDRFTPSWLRGPNRGRNFAPDENPGTGVDGKPVKHQLAVRGTKYERKGAKVARREHIPGDHQV